MPIAEGFSPAVWEGEMANFSLHLIEGGFNLTGQAPHTLIY